jgi:predicted DNA-binding transcriptional regulator YafY
MCDVGDTPGRMLELLSLLQSRHSWGGAELAERLEVTERTVRRDVDRLRMLGYPVEAVPGRYGGYRLGRGGRLPPLLLNDDEAVAVAIGLRAAVDGTVTGMEESAVSTLAKLDQILPAHLAGRVRSVHESTASLLWRGDERTQRVDARVLLLLANACSVSERVRFAYTDKGGKGTNRLVEPLRVVRGGARWYLVGRDIDRADWRTFRLDRIKSAENVGTRFELADPPDPVALVTEGLAATGYPFRALIQVPLPLEEAARAIPRTFAMVEGDDGTTVVELGSTSLERMVGYVAGLSPPCKVLQPPELKEALRLHLRAVNAANR